MEKVSENPSVAGGAIRWLRRHAAALLLLGGVLLALPAYLSAMEIQILDLEFLASLCGISGWGSGGR